MFNAPTIPSITASVMSFFKEFSGVKIVSYAFIASRKKSVRFANPYSLKRSIFEDSDEDYLSYIK